MVLVHEGLPEGKMLHGKYDACSRGIAREGKCCTVTYDARSRGIARGGNVAR